MSRCGHAILKRMPRRRRRTKKLCRSGCRRHPRDRAGQAHRIVVAGRSARWAKRQPDPYLDAARQPTHCATRSTLRMCLLVRPCMPCTRCRGGPGVAACQCRGHDLHLQEISRWVSPGAFAVMTLDGAGWHQTGNGLVVPDNIGLLRLPPYSPELNPVENIWEFLRHNDLSNRVFATYEAIVDACCEAWNKLIAIPERIRSIATRKYAKTVSS